VRREVDKMEQERSWSQCYGDIEDEYAQEMEEEEQGFTACEAIFMELCKTWLEQNAIRVLQDTVNKKPALKRQRATLDSSQYIKK